ncbi:Hsp70 family protein [Cognatiyoonia sp. IB215182]|uniref:Hsp70 family protein n=1 Tax=Cognatiyoonia sp. IB215182 TaxID=3097353 RepID=UPI002A136A58|nr:Hsp70 family protein [Cognatiyoonia sp. IB215182]MDX8355235.1 Hsp70 family protein [Cognatiyoonia sp. IB215182]
MQKMTDTAVFGIDLGTTNSAIAIVDNAGARIIPNRENGSTTPSVVAFRQGDKPVVGVAARNLAVAMPDAVAQHVKRRIGMESTDQAARMAIGSESYLPEEISALVIRKLVNDALEREGLSPSTPVKVVITVPAYFTSIGKKNTGNAAKLAGVDVLDLVHEPVAAAIAYGEARVQAPQTVLVYDLGGGTFDATVVEIGEGTFRTIATNGDRLLGGHDWDLAIAGWIVQQFEDAHPDTVPDLEDQSQKYRLLEAAETAKIALTELDDTTVAFHHEGHSISPDLTRETFELLTEHLLEETISRTEEVLKAAAGKGVHAPQTVVLVGGSTYMPAIMRRLKAMPTLAGCQFKRHEPDFAIAKGAALYAQMIASGVQAVDAAAPGAALSGSGRLVTQVNAKAIGVVLEDRDTNEKHVEYLIARNSELPTEVEKTFYTIKDNQSSVLVEVVEERQEPSAVVEENLMLNGGVFRLPAPLPDMAPLKYRLSLDGAGIVHVFVTDLKSGETWEMKIDRYRDVTDDQMMRLRPVMENVT